MSIIRKELNILLILLAQILLLNLFHTPHMETVRRNWVAK